MRSKSSSQKGASAVEFAIVLPLLIVITFGIIEFGMYIYNQQVITNASREGARVGIVAISPRVTPADIESVVRQHCDNHLVTFGSQNFAQLNPDPPVGYSPTATFPTDSLTVRVTYNYSFLVIPNFIPGIDRLRTMEAVTVMRYE